jgi:hypothetical protein
MLTDAKLRKLKAKDKAYKMVDREHTAMFSKIIEVKLLFRLLDFVKNLPSDLFLGANPHSAN